MYQKERIDNILSTLKENGYVTVKYLTEALHYSNATINRDLNIMEGRKLIVRSYGGAELLESVSVPLEFRYHKAKLAKRRISKLAADMICDGDTVFIDGTTTSEGIGDFITDKKDITVITNNMALAAHLSEYGIKAVCTGGNVIEAPYMLDGNDAVHTILRYNTDKMFFSSGGVSDSGVIKSGTLSYSQIYDAALKNADKVYYLIDKSKYNIHLKYNLTDFSEIDTVICDFDFPEETVKKYGNTKFYKV